MHSMTGYGRGSAEVDAHGLRIEIEISSLNRKTLDTYINLPREWSILEQPCAALLKEHFQRGRVQVQIKAITESTIQSGLAWSQADMEASLARLKTFAEKQGIPFEVDSHLLLELAKNLTESSGLPQPATVESFVQSALQQALTDIQAMRKAEGAILAADLAARIHALDEQRQQIAQAATQSVPRYREALLERLRQMQLEINLDDERVLKEIALYADRSDITEELTRLDSHFQQFQSFIEGSDACGRKMDFLCQEINRELNTIGSKSSQIEITRAIIECKNSLERIREQVQNIE